MKKIKVQKLFDTKISYFQSVKNNDSAVTVTLYEWITKYSSMYLNQICHVRGQYDKYLRGECDKKAYQDLKSYILPVCTPSVLIEGKRKSDNIKRMTGIICVDIDGLNNPDEIESVKQKIIRLPYCFMTAKSVSGYGVYAMIAYNRNNDFKATFLSLKNKFSEMGIEIDNACSDYVRSRFISFDRNTLIKNPESEIDVYDETELVSDDVNITELDTDDDRRYNENVDCSLIEKSIMFLVENGYGKRNYGYSSWLMDGFRLASLDDKKLGLELFLTISRSARGYSSDEDVMHQFKVCMHNNRWKNNVAYFYGKCKKLIGDGWITNITGKFITKNNNGRKKIHETYVRPW